MHARAKWRAPAGAVERGVWEALANAEATAAPWAALLLAAHYGASFAVQLGGRLWAEPSPEGEILRFSLPRLVDPPAARRSPVPSPF